MNASATAHPLRVAALPPAGRMSIAELVASLVRHRHRFGRPASATVLLARSAPSPLPSPDPIWTRP